MNIFQITQEDIDRLETLDPDDLGTWCFIVNGCYMGFTETREECEELAKGLQT